MMNHCAKNCWVLRLRWLCALRWVELRLPKRRYLPMCRTPPLMQIPTRCRRNWTTPLA